jgi:hypothetical protein
MAASVGMGRAERNGVEYKRVHHFIVLSGYRVRPYAPGPAEGPFSKVGTLALSSQGQAEG